MYGKCREIMDKLWIIMETVEELWKMQRNYGKFWKMYVKL